MEPNKNIDRLFQEKFRDFEKMPPDIVWDAIEARLNGKKKKRIIPIWWQYAGVAAVLLLISFSTFQYFKNAEKSISIDNTIVDVDNNNTPLIDNNLPNNKINDNTIVSSSDDNTNSNQSIPNSKKENNLKNKSFKQESSNINESTVIVKNTTNQSRQTPALRLNDKNKSASKNDLIVQTAIKKPLNNNPFNTTSPKEKLNTTSGKSTNTNIITSTDISSNTNLIENKEEKQAPEKVAFENIENLEDTLHDKDKLKEKEEQVDDLGNRWSIATVVAPVFYNSFSTKGSPLDLQFDNSPKEGSQSLSYGVKIGFKLNKKWSVQSGVSMMNVGYSVGDIYINPTPQGNLTSRLTNVDYIPTATILNISTNVIIDSNQIETSINKPIKGSLNQEYGYIEVPLEIKYNLTNGRLGVNLIGGFSTLFLNSNTVYVETPQFYSELGEARNLNDIDFSGNFGFDIDYSINKHLYINVAPMLKVYTNTFSDNYENSDNFKPYLFGIYTGLNYRF